MYLLTKIILRQLLQGRFLTQKIDQLIGEHFESLNYSKFSLSKPERSQRTIARISTIDGVGSDSKIGPKKCNFIYGRPLGVR